MKKKTSRPEPSCLADQPAVHLVGFDDKDATAFAQLKIHTLADLQSCNPVGMAKSVRIAPSRLMRYRNMARVLLALRFDREIVEALVEKQYRLMQAVELGEKQLLQAAFQDKQRAAAFLQAVSHLGMFVQKPVLKELSVEILTPSAAADVPPPAETGLDRGAEKKRYAELLANNKVATLVERMLEGWIKELTPRWELNTKLGYVYPEAEEIIDPNNTVVDAALKELQAAGILERIFFDKLFRCPFCNYPTVILRYSCIRCGSRNIRPEGMIQHYRCGHVDLARNFKAEKSLVCRQCGIELESLGKDYSKPGIMYQCQQCGDISGSVYKRMFCYNCSSIVEKDKELLEDIWVYKLNKEKQDLLMEVLNPKKKIIGILTGRGFHPNPRRTSAGKIRGISETQHHFDIYAEKEATTLLIEIATDENQVEITSLYNLFAKARDLGVDHAVLFAVPAASAAAERYAAYYRITVFKGDNLAGIIDSFDAGFEDMLSRKFRTPGMPPGRVGGAESKTGFQERLDLLLDITDKLALTTGKVHALLEKHENDTPAGTGV